MAPDTGSGDAADPDELPAARFVRLACLTYIDDTGPDEWATARALLVDHPELTTGDIHAAAAAADVAEVRRILAADRDEASRPGGPHAWQPLLVLTAARHDPTVADADVVATARALVAAGADPNTRFLIGDLETPFTALTMTFGEGEMGPTLQPRHPHALALARTLLEAGADPNDDQALYNRMFEADDDHLALLFEFGLDNADLLSDQLSWAVIHGMTERVALLADHGVDLTAPLDGGRTPSELAAWTGHPELVQWLADRGVPRPALGPDDAFVAAALAADRAAVEQLRADHPGIVERVRADRTGLVPWAAAIGNGQAVEVLVELGFDVNAKGRTDVPGNQPWQTTLHKAVEDDDLELARTLLGLGADPDVHDQRFDSTPLGWAHYFDRPRMIALLEPLTAT